MNGGQMTGLEKFEKWLEGMVPKHPTVPTEGDSAACEKLASENVYLSVLAEVRRRIAAEKATAPAKCVSGHDGGCPWYIPGSTPPSRHQADEPLAVLADRKGYAVYSNKRIRKPVRDFPWHISLTFIKSTNERKSFYCDTYAEAESKAKAYLNGLEDRKENI